MTAGDFVSFLSIGLCGGFLSGLLGIGGGVVIVPMLLFMRHEPIHVAKAHSLAIIVLIALAGTLKQWHNGRLAASDLGLILAAGLAAVFASPLGVSVGEKLDRATLGRLFGVLMIYTGIKFFLPARPATPAPTAATAPAPAEPGGPALAGDARHG